MVGHFIEDGGTKGVSFRMTQCVFHGEWKVFHWGWYALHESGGTSMVEYINCINLCFIGDGTPVYTFHSIWLIQLAFQQVFIHLTNSAEQKHQQHAEKLHCTWLLKSFIWLYQRLFCFFCFFQQAFETKRCVKRLSLVIEWVDADI